MAKFSGLPLDFRPGSQFSYSNSGYVVLTAILETVSGQTYAEYLAGHIFQPVGMEQTNYDNADIVLDGRAAGYTLDGAGYQNAEFFDMSNVAGAGGLVSTVHDMYRWDRALYTDAVLNETSRHSYFAPTVELGEGGQYTYGGGLLEIAGRDYLLFSGQISGFFTTSLRYPDEEIFVIVLSKESDPVAQAIALGLAAIALGDPYETPGQDVAIEVDPAIYERYVGQYAIEPDTVVTILTEEGHLFAQVPGQPRFEIFPSSETEYFAMVGNTRIQLQFQIGADGMATGMTVKQDGQEIQAEKISEGVSK
jgi:CubicO group peptidase (beta-lactamase class C family)